MRDKPVKIMLFCMSFFSLVGCGGDGDSTSPSKSTAEITFHAPLDTTQASVASLVESKGQNLAADFQVDGATLNSGVRGGVRGGIRGGIRAIAPRRQSGSEDFAWEVSFPVSKDAKVEKGAHTVGILVFAEDKPHIRLLKSETATSLGMRSGAAEVEETEAATVELITEAGRQVPNIINLAAGIDPTSSAPDATQQQIEKILADGALVLPNIPRGKKP